MGTMNALEETYELLCAASARHKRSVAVLEHLALVASLTGRSEELDRVLKAIEDVDPTSSVLAIAESTTPESSRRWAEDVSATQAHLLRQAGGSDAAASAAAVGELERWTRSFPANSTYAVNHALGLLSSGRVAEAERAALAALRIEDGTFADAFNIGQVLCHTASRPQGVDLLRSALLRATSAEEQRLAAEALARTGER
jgi:hypothetical protein